MNLLALDTSTDTLSVALQCGDRVIERSAPGGAKSSPTLIPLIRELMAQAGVEVNQTVCIGDDSIDLPAFAACGLSYAVADAPVYVQARASAVLVKEGGKGAFRELADAILVAQGKEHVFGSADGFSTVMGRVVQ